MLKPTSNTILLESLTEKKAKMLNETSLFSKNPSKTNQVETVNTIKVDFNKMSKTKISSHPFTKCECGAIVTAEDQKQKYEREGEYIAWTCKYCKRVNRTKELHFCENNYKTVINKNNQRVFLPPIIVFLIDISGSMGESVSVQADSTGSNKEGNLFTAQKEILEIIKGSSFFDKQHMKQMEMKSMYGFEQQKDQFKKTKIQGSQYFSRIALFMGIIQNYLKKMKIQPQSCEYRIGFVFFNENIHILKPVKQKIIPTFVNKNSKFSNDFPFEKNVIDFNNFDQLFETGQKYERFFGDSRLKTCDFSKLMVQNLQIDGMTALGPALAIGLGIMSVHDIGSRMVIVSDSIPNIGILSPQTHKLNQQAYEKIRKVIESKQSTISVLDWISEQGKTYQERINSQFGEFLASDSARIKYISLDFSLKIAQNQVLATAKKSLESLISRGSLGPVISLKLHISNTKIEVTKCKYDEMDYRFVKFLGLHSKNWIQLKPKKVTEEDFLFPIQTQIVVEYQDVFTKQKYLFMSYVKQKLIGLVSQKQMYEYLENSNNANVKELIDLERIFKFDRESVQSEYTMSKDYRNRSINSSMGMHQNAQMIAPLDFSVCDSLNSLAKLQVGRQDDDQYL